MRPWRKDNFWPLSITEVKNEWSDTFTAPIDLRLHSVNRCRFTSTYRRSHLELTVFWTSNGSLWKSYHNNTNTINIADTHLWPDCDSNWRSQFSRGEGIDRVQKKSEGTVAII
jgi:hypothetical protein